MQMLQLNAINNADGQKGKQRQLVGSKCWMPNGFTNSTWGSLLNGSYPKNELRGSSSPPFIMSWSHDITKVCMHRIPGSHGYQPSATAEGLHNNIYNKKLLYEQMNFATLNAKLCNCMIFCVRNFCATD